MMYRALREKAAVEVETLRRYRGQNCGMPFEGTVGCVPRQPRKEALPFGTSRDM